MISFLLFLSVCLFVVVLFFRWDGMEGVLPIFSLQNKLMLWSASAKEEKQRSRGWLLGTTGLQARCSADHAPSPSN